MLSLALATAILQPGSPAGLSEASGPEYILTVTGNWEVINVVDPRGIDFIDQSYVPWVADIGTGKLMHGSSWNPGLMFEGPAMPETCDMARDLASTGAYGETACSVYLNDSEVDSIFFGYYSWQTLPNPAGYNGYGMDCDQFGYFWEAREDYIYRFEPGGTIQAFSFHVPRTGPWGVATYPMGGPQTGVAVSYSYDHVIEFYSFQPISDWTYLGHGIVPWGYFGCYGLDYDPGSGSFFMLVLGTSCWELLRISSTFVGLQQDTWGSIKAVF